MAKAAKDRPAGAKSSTAKLGGAKTPASPPTPARKSTKAAPGIPSVRVAERQTSRNTPAALSPEEVYRLIRSRPTSRPRRAASRPATRSRTG